MIRDITIGQYIPGESILHRADPRIKIILVMVYMVVAIILNSYTGLIILALFTILTVVLSGVPIGYALRGLKPILFILVFAAVINILTAKGTVAFSIGFIHITYEGLNAAAKLIIRLTALFMEVSLVLTLTSKPLTMADGIEKLMSPLKRIGVPAHEIAMMMTIALRFIPTLLEETDKIIKAQSSRGADFDTGNIVQKAKSFIPVLVPLFVSAFRRADELAVAMEARCYRGSVGRTRMKQLHMTRIDLILTIAMVVFASGLLYIEFM
ncbi:MAG: energy-coupling factor transporter transmembrane component T [Bacillota bacterium]|nr:energy-coupling factor transporter transmembrane component T [Bacillota bacterium]